MLEKSIRSNRWAEYRRPKNLIRVVGRRKRTPFFLAKSLPRARSHSGCRIERPNANNYGPTTRSVARTRLGTSWRTQYAACVISFAPQLRFHVPPISALMGDYFLIA